MKYGIFKREIVASGGIVVLTFKSLTNPTDPATPLTIEAENSPAAANQAHDLLKLLGTQTHAIGGHEDTIMSAFPLYFVGQFTVDLADRYDSGLLLYQIDTFTPVPQD